MVARRKDSNPNKKSFLFITALLTHCNGNTELFAFLRPATTTRSESFAISTRNGHAVAVVPNGIHSFANCNLGGGDATATGTALYSRKPYRKQKKRVQRDPANHAKDWQGHYDRALSFVTTTTSSSSSSSSSPHDDDDDGLDIVASIGGDGGSSGGRIDIDRVEQVDPDLAAWVRDQSEQIRWLRAGQGKKARITKKRADAIVRAGLYVEGGGEGSGVGDTGSVSFGIKVVDDDDDWKSEVESGKDWVAEQASEERGRIGRQRLKTSYEKKKKA